MRNIDLDFVRAQFPAFAEPSLERQAFFENAGGSYACRPVIERLNEYRRLKVQPYYGYPASLEAGEWMDAARVRLAEYLKEVVLGRDDDVGKTLNVKRGRSTAMPPLTTLSPPRRYVLGFVLLSLLDARSRPVSSGDAVTTDYSQFERFEFRQESGFGFCPLEGAPYKATIVRRPAGGYSFGESVLEERVMTSADCIPLVRSGTCLVERRLPSRELAPEEVSRLKAVFSQIIVRTSPDAKCQGQLVIDYCRTIRCRWDDHLHDDAECERDSLPKSQIDQLLMLLEELHRGGVADREKSAIGKATRAALVAAHFAIERSLMSGIAIREQRWRMMTSTMPSQLFGPPKE